MTEYNFKMDPYKVIYCVWFSEETVVSYVWPMS